MTTEAVPNAPCLSIQAQATDDDAWKRRGSFQKRQNKIVPDESPRKTSVSSFPRSQFGGVPEDEADPEMPETSR